MPSSKRARWIAVFLYVGFIFATLGFVPAPLRFLREHGVLRLSLLACYLTCLGFLLRKMWIHPQKTWARVGLLIGVFSLYPVFSRWTSSPEEQIHFFEYGLVGVLFARALQTEGTPRFRTLLWALVLGSLTGWVDELVQGLLPNRHYDQKDIFLNVLSVGLGLILYRLFPTAENPSSPPPESFVIFSLLTLFLALFLMMKNA